MRKTSQDGGDSTSITSGIENEFKKSSISLIKPKKNSIKKKVQSLCHESDDGVIEPLLQKDKDKPETNKHSAKYLPSTFKTESDKSADKDLKVTEPKVPKTHSPVSSKDSSSLKSPSSNNAPFYNHMNTNVFANQQNFKATVPTQSQILVEIDGNKPVSYTPSPLIFTTAKIHTDGKIKQMEPVQVTPVPILSTLEGSSMKSGVTTTINKDNILPTIPTISEQSESKKNEYLNKNGNTISTGNIKIETRGNNVISDSSAVHTNTLIDTKSQPLIQEIKTIKTLGCEKNKSETESVSVSKNTPKTPTTEVKKSLQCSVSNSPTSLVPIKNTLPTPTSKCTDNNTIRNSTTANGDQGFKISDNKSSFKELSKVQESHTNSSKNDKISNLGSYKTTSQISSNNMNLPSTSKDNNDKEKVNKLAANKQCQKNLDSDIIDLKSKPTHKQAGYINSVAKDNKDGIQPITTKGTESITKTTPQNDKSKSITSNINTNTTTGKPNKQPISSVNQQTSSTLSTKQLSNTTSSIVVCNSTVSQSANTVSTSKAKTSKAKVDSITSSSKSDHTNVIVSTNVKTSASNKKLKSENTNTSVPKSTSQIVSSTPISKLPNISNASTSTNTSQSNTTSTKTTNVPNPMVATTSTLSTSTSSNKK